VNYRPIDESALAGELADYLSGIPGIVRVAVDGATATDPDGLAASLIAPLGVRSRPAVHVRADGFWRDASLRLEYGHTDTHSLRHDWLDVEALRRELLDPLGGAGAGGVAAGAMIITSLRDPVTNRSTREPAQLAAPNTVLLVSGQFLLGHALPFDRVLRLSASAAALARRTPAELAWTLAAVAEYEAEVRPSDQADIDIRVNDPRHPAVLIRSR